MRAPIRGAPGMGPRGMLIVVYGDVTLHRASDEMHFLIQLLLSRFTFKMSLVFLSNMFF